MKKTEIDLSPDKEHMKTLSSCTSALNSAGYVTQFKVQDKKLKSLTTGKLYSPEEVRITSFYRFEGESDPADNSILYLIETNFGEKGTLSDAYGVYSDANINDFVKEVNTIKKKKHHVL